VACEVNVTDNLWDDISIEEGDDRSLVITATGSNGAVTQLKVLDMMFWYGEETDEGQSAGGVIITDVGIFDGVLNLMGDGRFSIGINVSGLPDDAEGRSVVTSNYLTEGDWLTARLIFEDIYPVWSVPVTQFYGRITADNIDGLIKVAVMSMAMDLIENSAITDKGDYLEIDGEAIQGAVSLIFAVDDVDMTLSENYDAETGMYRFYDYGTDEAYTNIMPTELYYENGCWCLKATVLGKPGEAADTYTVKLDEEFRISVIYTDNTLIIGDANSDGKVNGIDINYMKRALAGTYDVNIAMDINGDGKVNGTDVNLLKRYLVGSYVI
ncbi:MAG: dockerin type I repeat-containing protein, partial [Candidatus Avispirillum sp.]